MQSIFLNDLFEAPAKHVDLSATTDIDAKAACSPEWSATGQIGAGWRSRPLRCLKIRR